MDDYCFYVIGNSIILPIPLPTGNESLDDLVGMGVKYSRASRIAQGLGSPLQYRINGDVVEVIKDFSNMDELVEKLSKALEGIESLRYFI
nr:MULTISPECIES: hypothetical protein [Acidianus]